MVGHVEIRYVGVKISYVLSTSSFFIIYSPIFLNIYIIGFLP